MEAPSAVPNGRSKLTSVDVMAIRASSATDAELARRYGVHKDTLRAARRGHTWGHLPGALGPRNGRRNATHHLSDEDIAAIRRSPATGVELARRYRLTSQTLSRIRLGQIRPEAGGPIRNSGTSSGPAPKRAKLSPAQVDAIRNSSEGLVALALEYGVSVIIINRVQQGRPWKHLRNDGPPREN